ncbi:MAG: hypothetical protein RIM99_15340 [Cyclobacteriaceae bacterium]
MGGSPLFTFLSYLSFLKKAKGPHSLHSPFVFTLYKEVIKPSSHFRLKKIEGLRRSLRNNHQLIDAIDFKTNTSKRKTLSSIAGSSLSSAKFSAFLHLLINHLHSNIILETGTSLGINTLYLATAGGTKTVTIEGSIILAELAKKQFERMGASDILIESGDVNKIFQSVVVRHEPDFVFLDADHRGATILNQVEILLQNEMKPRCIVIHDIYWSKDMNETWKRLVKDERFNLTIDIFQAGLIFSGKNMEKQHFTLRF